MSHLGAFLPVAHFSIPDRITTIRWCHVASPNVPGWRATTVLGTVNAVLVSFARPDPHAMIRRVVVEVQANQFGGAKTRTIQHNEQWSMPDPCSVVLSILAVNIALISMLPNAQPFGGGDA